jgi:hypothetical protein
MSTTSEASISRPPVARSSLFHSRRCALAAAVVAVALSGCDGGPQPSPVEAVLPQGDSHEAKLERVMSRLKFALSSAEGAGDYGVVSKRQSRYRLIPPSEKEPRPTAEVTVLTMVSLSDEAKQRAARPGADDAEETAPEPKEEKEVFLLVYDNDKWELPKKPESETLQICFDSALRDE